MQATPQYAAVITGGAGGIGEALSLQLARDGFFVYVCCHQNGVAAEALVERIGQRGGSGQVLTFDLTDAAAAERCLTLAAEGPHQITAVVHAAGIVKRSLFGQTSAEEWNSLININLNGFFYCVRPVLRKMIRARTGSVIAISSVVAGRGLEGQSAYAASKAGLTGAVRSLAREVGPYNIRANVISPGWIRAGMNLEDPPDPVRSRIPLRRAGTPEEVAELASFLCSSRAAYITGAVIPVSGGLDM